MVDCELDLNAILMDNSAGGGPALLFVNVFYHQPFVTSVTKTSKTGLPLFLSAKGYVGISKSETDPVIHGFFWLEESLHDAVLSAPYLAIKQPGQVNPPLSRFEKRDDSTYTS
jgi:hypothetical protein